MTAHFNRPPGWPAEPPGWVPPPGWRPDPAWPAPPAGWDLWIDEHGRPVAPPSAHETLSQAPGSGSETWVKSGWKPLVFFVGIVVLIAVIGGLASGGGVNSEQQTEGWKDGYQQGYNILSRNDGANSAADIERACLNVASTILIRSGGTYSQQWQSGCVAGFTASRQDDGLMPR
jgi:hypothetical protein